MAKQGSLKVPRTAKPGTVASAKSNMKPKGKSRGK